MAASKKSSQAKTKTVKPADKKKVIELKKPVKEVCALNESGVLEFLDDQLKEMRAYYRNAIERLDLGIDAEKFRPFKPDSQAVKSKIKKAFKDPLNRQSITAYHASKEALSGLMITVSKLADTSKSFSQLDLLYLFISLKHFGVARFCGYEGFNHDDLEDYGNIIVTPMKQEIANLTDRLDKFTRKPNTERDDYIRNLKKQYFGVLTHEAIYKKADKKIISDLKFSRFKNIK